MEKRSFKYLQIMTRKLSKYVLFVVIMAFGPSLFGQNSDSVNVNLQFHLQFLAVVIFVSFAAYLKYYQTRIKDFLYASLYLVVNFLYFMRWFDGDVPLVQPFLSHNSQAAINNWLKGDFWNSVMEVPLILLFIITYALFLSHFFDLKEKQPKVAAIFRKGIQIAFGIILLYILGSIVVFHWRPYQFLVSREVNTLLSTLFLLSAGLYMRSVIKNSIGARTRYYFYFMLGTTILIIGPVLSQLSLYFTKVFNGLDSFLYIEVSVLLEIAFFYQALSIKEDYFYEDRDRTTRELLVQKQANQALTITKLEADFNALKAQMNPHFIFNSLNSLKALIQEQQTQAAVDYLVKFSALVRIALEKSDQPLITLEEEIEFCTNYLAIETLRMPDLEYNIQLDQSVDLSFLEIPPFIIQPFIENALRHGLPLKEGTKELRLEVTTYDEGVLCKIEDNGVGREKAQQMKRLTKTERKRSLGLNNIKERLDIHQEIYQHEIRYELEDKKDANGNAVGTLIRLFIPD